MPDSEAKKKWDRENTIVIGAKVNRHTDADIFDGLKSVENVAMFVKQAVREKLERDRQK